MTSYKIENFFGHLDREQTIEAVEHGISLITAEEAVGALISNFAVSDLPELHEMLTAEIRMRIEGPIDPEADPRSVHYGYSEIDEHQLVADMLAEAKARKGGCP